MWSISFILVALTYTTAAAASPYPTNPIRRDVRYTPLQFGLRYAQAQAPPKTTTATTSSNRPHSTTARAILDAFYPDNNRYTIVFISAYPISSPLDLAFLAHVDVVITGQIHFNASDVYYWAEHGFKYKF
tara:strand:- start:888 stop:1277 length:390 start_codon:yes stop_codon:yes gene_type:complete